LEEGWFGSTNGGVVGGILMIVITIVWFVGGLYGGMTGLRNRCSSQIEQEAKRAPKAFSVISFCESHGSPC
jgi:hypothetical protein